MNKREKVPSVRGLTPAWVEGNTDNNQTNNVKQKYVKCGKYKRVRRQGGKSWGSATVDAAVGEGLSGDTFTEPETSELRVKPCGHQGEHYRQRPASTTV